MGTFYGYEVNLWEDEIRRDETGKIVHHPLNSIYCFNDGSDMPGYGHLTFAGHDMDKSSILEDVKVFYLEFRGEPEEIYDREAWADPLRAEVLIRLSDVNRCWYMSMFDISIRDIGDMITEIIGKQMNQIVVKSENAYGSGLGFRSREFVEVPNCYLSDVSRYFWSQASPGYPIEGYNMESGQIEVLRRWDLRPRDDKLFREVIDKTFVSFYTFPAEHRYFVFVTNKLNYADLANLIRLEGLQKRAKEMSLEME